MNSLGFEIRMKQYLLERLRAKHEALVQHYETCAPRNTTHGPTASEAWPMSEAAHNGSLVLLCGTEIKWGGGWRKSFALRPFHKSRMKRNAIFSIFSPHSIHGGEIEIVGSSVVSGVRRVQS